LKAIRVHRHGGREAMGPELCGRAVEIFARMAWGRLQQKIFRTYRLDEVAPAHRARESRSATGKLLVIP